MPVEHEEFIPARPSQNLVDKIRDLAHEATRRGEASELITAALELCVEYEIAVRVANNVGEKIEEISMMIGSYV